MRSLLFFVGVIFSFLFISFGCKKDNDNAITPTYRTAAPGMNGGANPNINQPYIPPITNTVILATQNSYLTIGSSGWSNPSCVTTNSLYLQSVKGKTEVTLQFSSAPSVGTSTYAVSLAPGPANCTIRVTGDPAQPDGTIWYGFSGSVSVTNNTGAITATIVGPVLCKQLNYLFPVITVTGILGCN